MKEYPIILSCLCIFLIHPSVSLAGNPDMSVASHLQRGNRYFMDNKHFLALDEYEEALRKDPENPDILRKLSLIYYDLGFLDESVSSMEKAVLLSPHSELVRMDMGIAYLAKGRLNDSKEQFMKVIAKNPGLADAYYYLGEIFYRAKEYGTAWMFAKRARCLGHTGNGLFIKLGSASEEPDEDPCIYDGEDMYIRQILVDSKSRAETVVEGIAEGSLFENVAGDEDRNRNINVGGYLGKFPPSEIDPRIARALAGHKAFSAPVIVETESGFHVIQQIAPFDLAYWKGRLSDTTGRKKKLKTAIGDTKPESSLSVNKAKGSGQISPPPSTAGEEKGRPSVPSIRENLKTDPAGDKELYLVYAGSNSLEQNAIEDVRKLISLGYPAYRYSETTESKGTLYIVIAGKYESFEKAKEAADNIVRQGFSVFIRKAD